MEDHLAIVLRVSVMYLYVLAILRLGHRETVSAIRPLDFVVTVIIGDMFDDVFWAEIPMAQGLVGITVIVLLHVLTSYFSYGSRLIARLVGSREVVVVRAGSLVEDGLRQERLNNTEVDWELRLAGVESIRTVREASIEPSGEVSVLLRDEAKPVEKRDLPLLQRRLQSKTSRRREPL